MALFKSKKLKKPAVEFVAETATPATAKLASKKETEIEKDFSEVLIRPRITEKATGEQQKNIYTFEIYPKASKRDVALAFQKFFKVAPVKVNIVKNPAKKVSLRGRYGMTKGVKKAYIYLKAGDKIDLV